MTGIDEKRVFKIERTKGMEVTKEEVLGDLAAAAAKAGSQKLTQALYQKFGRFDVSTASRKFGSWNKALEHAKLTPGNIVDYSDESLYENILTLWTHYGRQPRKAELASSPSKISEGPYKRRFKGWIEALSSFVEYANSNTTSPVLSDQTSARPRTSRDINLRQRFRVLRRDSFKCVSCGSSPANKFGVNLHIDHIVAWSKGGETIDENLQTLCEPCNLGKSNT